MLEIVCHWQRRGRLLSTFLSPSGFGREPQSSWREMTYYSSLISSTPRSWYSHFQNLEEISANFIFLKTRKYRKHCGKSWEKDNTRCRSTFCAGLVVVCREVHDASDHRASLSQRFSGMTDHISCRYCLISQSTVCHKYE